MTEDRCKHDLLRRDCGDCKPRPRPVVSLTPVSMVARYPGTCSACGELIAPGDRITRSPEGDGWVCEYCANIL